MKETMQCSKCGGSGQVAMTSRVCKNLKALKAIQPATSRQFAEHLKIAHDTANRRLERMVKSGLAVSAGRYPAKYRVK